MSAKPPVVDLGHFEIKSLRVEIEPSFMDGWETRVTLVAGRDAHRPDATGRGPNVVVLRTRLHDREIEAPYFKQLIRDQLIKALVHELDEWLRVDGELVNHAHNPGEP